MKNKALFVCLFLLLLVSAAYWLLFSRYYHSSLLDGNEIHSIAIFLFLIVVKPLFFAFLAALLILLFLNYSTIAFPAACEMVFRILSYGLSAWYVVCVVLLMSDSFFNSALSCLQYIVQPFYHPVYFLIVGFFIPFGFSKEKLTRKDEASR